MNTHSRTPWLRLAFVVLVIRPLVRLWLAPRVRGRDQLPEHGPAIVAANHNSHLDTVLIMSLFPLKTLKHVRAVAAADYWLASRARAWFARHLIGIVPIARTGSTDPLAPIHRALDQDQIVIFFPEGTRGEPEQMQRFKSGLGRLAERRPDIPVVPVFLRGTGHAWPRVGRAAFPAACDVRIGAPEQFAGEEPRRFVSGIRRHIVRLSRTQTSLEKSP